MASTAVGWTNKRNGGPAMNPRLAYCSSCYNATRPKGEQKSFVGEKKLEDNLSPTRKIVTFRIDRREMKDMI